jgi:hypothetical protein
LDERLPPESADTARDLVSPYQGSPEWILPLGEKDGRLTIAKRGRLRSITLDGQVIGEIPAPDADRPWIEVPFERRGHAFVVASRFGPRPSRANAWPAAAMEVFADGINLHDGRSLDGWRASRQANDPLEVWIGFRLPPFRRFWLAWLGLGVLIVSSQWSAYGTQPAGRAAAAFLWFPVAYKGVFGAQERIYARKDVRVRLRVLASMASWVVFAVSLPLVVLASSLVFPGR